jgi:hypothetical protein
MPSFCKVNKRPAEPVWIDGEQLPLAETEYGRQYCARVRAIVRLYDDLFIKLGIPDYKGVTLGTIHRQLGDDVDRELTLTALGDAYVARLIPERYSYIQPQVKSIPPEEWPDTITSSRRPLKTWEKPSVGFGPGSV